MINPFFLIASIAESIVARNASPVNSRRNVTAAVSVTRFTAHRSTSSRSPSVFCTPAEHPPHRMPSTANNTVSSLAADVDAVGADAFVVSSSRTAADARETTETAREDVPGGN